MDHKGILSSAFNMSLGFIPVIISILLCELITQDTAIYIGTGIGIIGIYLSYRRKGLLIPNFILYIATGVLALLSVAALIPGDYVPPGALPLTLEVSILIPSTPADIPTPHIPATCRCSSASSAPRRAPRRRRKPSG